MLVNEVLALLEPRSGHVYADCTAGLGGHAAAVAAAIGERGTVVLADLDAGNLAASAARVCGLANAPRVETLHGSFAALPRHVASLGLRADLVLADLGFASNQVDDAARGLSFMRDGPLDMRLNPAATTTAAVLVASASEGELADIIFTLGEERHARAVAAAIVRERAASPIRTTAQLADVVRSAVRRAGSGGGGKGRGIDPATRTFQAIRMAVNDELGNLDALLAALDTPGVWLSAGATIAIITFHSLEDRPVKQAFARLGAAGLAQELTPKPLRPSADEMAANPRAGSAKVRAIRLVGREA